MAEKIPGSRLLILEDAGHCAFLEEHEVLDAEIAAFADEVLVPARAARPPQCACGEQGTAPSHPAPRVEPSTIPATKETA